MFDNLSGNTDDLALHRAAGLSEADVGAFAGLLGEAPRSQQTLAEFHQCGRALLARLPLRSQRSPEQTKVGAAIVRLMADRSWCFFREHAASLYRDITGEGTRSLRVDALLREAAARWPHILPSDEALAEESNRMQADKDGLEINQGLFVSQVLIDPPCGHHLLRSMLRPHPRSLELIDAFRRDGHVDLGCVKIELKGAVAHVTLHNERYLNAEDDTTVEPLEIATDLVLLHPETRIGVLRGSVVDHPKYAGRRIFCSGINLTRIYNGKQSYVSFLLRNIGLHNKLYRGVLTTTDADSLDAPLNEPEQTLEKLWIAVVETFAIGGGCQLLLVVDRVIAEEGSYFNLPARKEGILPGTSNLRLPRYLGERLARDAILFDRTIYADSPEGRLIANDVVPRGDIDATLEACVLRSVDSGVVSTAANRKAIRQNTEPLDTLRRYLVTYAYEQAFTHLSDQLIENLERHWNAKSRKL